MPNFIFVCQQCWVGLKSFQNTACIRYVGLRGQCQLTRPSRPNAVLAVADCNRRTVEAAEAVLPVGMSGCEHRRGDACQMPPSAGVPCNELHDTHSLPAAV
jgi:hypothetical protein